MVSIPLRIAVVTLCLTAGCSSSGLFNRSASRDRSAVTDGFASDTETADPPGRKSSSPAQRIEAPAARSHATANANPRREQTAVHLAEANRLESSGDTAGARAAYERVVQIDPSHFLANYQLAVIADNEGRFADAERHYRLLLARSPNSPDLLASLGWSYLLQRRYDESERALRKALSIDARHRTALYNLGWLYGTLGDYDAAAEIFRSAGTEADAQRALAELFPRGRPAGGQGIPTGAPRNPFKPAEADLASATPGSLRRPQDRLAGGTVTAPAPWQKPSTALLSAGNIAAAGNPGSAETRAAEAARRTAAGDAGNFDQIFDDLASDTSGGGAGRNPPRGPRTGVDAPLNSLPGNPGPGTERPGAVETVGYVEPDEFLPPGSSPSITPRSTSTGGASRSIPADWPGKTSPDGMPGDQARGTAAAPALPADDHPLPDWPYHASTARAGRGLATGEGTTRPNPRTTAAQLGLAAGPNGFLFGTPPAASNAPRTAN